MSSNVFFPLHQSTISSATTFYLGENKMKRKIMPGREKEKKKHRKKFKGRSRASKLFYKFMLFIGITLTLKGLKGWLKSKKREAFGG